MADKFRKAGSNLRKGVKSMIKESREIINNLKKKTSQEKGEDKSKDAESTDMTSDDSSSEEIEDIGAIAANLMSETKKLTNELRKLEQEYDKQTDDKRRIKKEKEDIEGKYKVLSNAFIDAVRIIDDFASGERKSGPDQLLDFNEDMSKSCISLMKSVYDQRDNELLSNCILKYCTEIPTSPRASVQLSGENGRPKSTEVKSPVRIASPRNTVTFAEPVVPKEEPVQENHEELIVSIFQGLHNESMSPKSSANVTPVKTTSAVTSSNTSTPTTTKTNEIKVSTPEVKSETKTSPRTHAQSTNDAVKSNANTASPKPANGPPVELVKKASWTTTRPKSVAIESSVVNASILSNKRMSGAVDMTAGTISSPLHPTTATLSTPTPPPKPYSAPTSPNQPSTTTNNNTVSSSLPTSPAGPSNVKSAVQVANAKTNRANPTPPPSSNTKREPPRLSQVIPNYRPPKKATPTESSPSHATPTQTTTNSPSHPSALDKLLSPLTSPTQVTTTSNNNTAATSTPPPKLNFGSNTSTPTNKQSAVQSAVANIEKTSPRATGPTSPRTSVTSGNNPASPRNSVALPPTPKTTSTTTTPVTSPTNKTTTSTTSTASPSVNTKIPEPSKPAQTSTWTKTPTKPLAESVKKVESPAAPEKPKTEEKATSPRKESSATNTPTKPSESSSIVDTNAKPVITDESDAEDLIKFILRSV
jgi:hypothetical protein